ncbi:MAG: 3-phosphoshikimate 1-carboxyvinyltransferase [Vulcanimicrobiaceae bacterium]
MSGEVAVGPAQASLRGTLRVPGDKSIGHRALLFSALAEGTTTVRGLSSGEDVRSTRRCLETMGTVIRDDGELVVVHGKGGDFTQPCTPLDCGNSGTTMRLLAGILAGREIDATLDGDASLRRRPMRRIAEPLRTMGALIELREDGVAPIRVRGSSSLRGIAYELPMPSAQLKSALLLAALGARGTTKLGGALRSRDHTERMLPIFAGALRAQNGTIVLDGPQRLRAPENEIQIPGDLSSAAYWIAAASIIPDSRLEVEDVGLNPSRLGFVDVLRRMGATIEIHQQRTVPEPSGTILVRGSALRGTTVEAAEIPALIDELPLLAVVAAFAEGTTIVHGAEELRLKESDRIDAVIRNGRAMGMDIEGYPDGFAVHGPRALRGADVDAMDDHRIAMAFAVASLGASGTTRIHGAQSVAISYPEFFSILETLRG